MGRENPECILIIHRKGTKCKSANTGVGRGKWDEKCEKLKKSHYLIIKVLPKGIFSHNQFELYL